MKIDGGFYESVKESMLVKDKNYNCVNTMHYKYPSFLFYLLFLFYSSFKFNFFNKSFYSFNTLIYKNSLTLHLTHSLKSQNLSTFWKTNLRQETKWNNSNLSVSMVVELKGTSYFKSIPRLATYIIFITFRNLASSLHKSSVYVINR